MPRLAKRIVVTPDSELASLLDEADRGPLLLEKGGRVYRLAVDGPDDIWEGYDPEKVREAIAETAGSWADVDAEKLIADIYRWREEGSRPPDRP